MATYTSSQYDRQTGNAGQGVKFAMGDYNGRERQFYFEVTPAAATGTTDVVKLFVLPANVRVISWLIDVPNTGAGVFNLGWAASQDGTTEVANATGFGSGYNSGGQRVLIKPAGGEAGLHKTFAAPVEVQLVPTTATTAGNVLIKGHFTYVMD